MLKSLRSALLVVGLVNLIGACTYSGEGEIAYCLRDRKPSLDAREGSGVLIFDTEYKKVRLTDMVFDMNVVEEANFSVVEFPFLFILPHSGRMETLPSEVKSPKWSFHIERDPKSPGLWNVEATDSGDYELRRPSGIFRYEFLDGVGVISFVDLRGGEMYSKKPRAYEFCSRSSLKLLAV